MYGVWSHLSTRFLARIVKSLAISRRFAKSKSKERRKTSLGVHCAGYIPRVRLIVSEFKYLGESGSMPRAEGEASAARESIMREKRTYRREAATSPWRPRWLPTILRGIPLALVHPAPESGVEATRPSSSRPPGRASAPSQGLRSLSLTRLPRSRRFPTPTPPLRRPAPSPSRAQPRSRSCSCRDANGGARASVVGRQSFRGSRRSRRTTSPCAPMSRSFPLDASIIFARRGRREPRP